MGSAAETPDEERAARGRQRALNLYLNDLNGGLLGWATFPDEYASAAADGRRRRPQRVAARRQRGAVRPGRDGDPRGRPLAGPLPHLPGRLPTANDLVADTPAEASPAFGCPEGRDTCAAAGLDPIHNFMDYTDDACMYEFTPGQVARLDAQTAAYRNTAPASVTGSTVSTVGGTPVAVTPGGTDPDGDALTYEAVGAPAHGTVAASGAGLVYTAVTGFTGSDTFAIRAVDAFGARGATTATVTVNVAPRAASTTKAKARKKVRQGKKVKVKVTVTASAPAGTVQVTEKGKVLGTGTVSGSGKVTVSVGKLKVGKHKLTVTFGGSATVAPSTDKVTVRVLQKKASKK